MRCQSLKIAWSRLRALSSPRMRSRPRIVRKMVPVRSAPVTSASVRSTPVNFTRANLTGVDLTDADVTGADLTGTILRTIRGRDRIRGLGKALNRGQATLHD